MYLINRVILKVLRTLYKIIPLPVRVKNKVQQLYLKSVYARNKKNISQSNVYGERKQKDISSYILGCDRNLIIDAFIHGDSLLAANCTPRIHKTTELPIPPQIKIFRDYSDYVKVEDERKQIRKVRNNFEESLLMSGSHSFEVDGYCSVCQTLRQFDVNYLYAYEKNHENRLIPNWRESLVCNQCGMNNRIRAAVDLLDNQLAVPLDNQIYATEQLTPFFTWLRYCYSCAIGSEYLGDEETGGEYYDELRHEDITQLSFDDNSLDCILSFDVLEHVPDTDKSLTEFIRCLKPGGFMLISAPFVSDQYETIVRAKINIDGEVEHLLEPEYHGNPTKPAEGSLCYYHFGWQLLEQMKDAGATDVAVISYYSSERANLGNEQLFFMALK